MATTRLGFLRGSGDINAGIFVPKYYDPSIGIALHELGQTHDLVPLRHLIESGDVTVHYGQDIGKHYYGLGNIPYVRTSDIATWEVVSAPKQTVGREAYDIYAPRQDVRAGDVFFIRDGLYLIGRTALVTEYDLPLIHQSHMIRLRVKAGARIGPSLLMGVLSTPVVTRQVRSKQFTAGIIDKIEDRFEELVLPIPGTPRSSELDEEISQLVQRRAYLRERLKSIPSFAQGLIEDIDAPPKPAKRIGYAKALAYRLPSASVEDDVLIPKYYDPGVAEQLAAMSADFELRTIRSLVDDGVLSVSTGLEVGKMAYGLGEIPFIRTSDLADWELAGQPKQRISSELYAELRARVDLQTGDILLVRDGTYLVGTSAILAESDARAIYAGGLYKLRVRRPEIIDPYLLISVLNTPIVKAQIRARQFTRDIIDTLGLRLYDVVIPIPKSLANSRLIADTARAVTEERAALRDRAKAIVLEIEGAVAELPEEREAAEELEL
jgi:hypothetical protein